MERAELGHDEASLQTAACAGVSDVWAVGGGGAILATTDGGYLAPT